MHRHRGTRRRRRAAGRPRARMRYGDRGATHRVGDPSQPAEVVPHHRVPHRTPVGSEATEGPVRPRVRGQRSDAARGSHTAHTGDRRPRGDGVLGRVTGAVDSPRRG